VGIEKLLEKKRAISPLRDKDLMDIKQLENCRPAVKDRKAEIKPSEEFERALCSLQAGGFRRSYRVSDCVDYESRQVLT